MGGRDAALPENQTLPRIAILLATYQDTRFLNEQLDSIASQSFSDWAIWASDDSEDDETWEVLRLYQRRLGIEKLHIQKGPQRGFVANFLSLVCQANIEADYFAYCDQDDVWEVDKLERAVRWLAEVPADTPALYCSRTRLVDEQNREIGLSPLFSRAPSFANALVQNIGGGNTMVFNRAARALLIQAGADLPLITHDWWTYIVVSGCGGRVHYDVKPSVRYRQHHGNLIGHNIGWLARVNRLKMLLSGDLSSVNDKHVAALKCLRNQITPDNLTILDSFSSARGMSLAKRLTVLSQAGVHRQTRLGNVGLFLASVLNKI